MAVHRPRVSASGRGRFTRRAWSVVAAVAILALLSGCGGDDDDDSSSATTATTAATATTDTTAASADQAEQDVCDARSDLRDSVDQVATDVKAANFGDAKDSITQVGDAYDQLAASVSDLGEEQRAALEPQVEAFKTELTSLQDAESLSDITGGLDAAVTQAETIYNDVADTLSCD